MRMNKLSLLSLAVTATTFSHAAHAEDLGNLFTQGKPILDARYRFENVDQDNALRDANAQTLRTRVGFQSGKWYGLSGLVEVDNVSRLGDAAYNDTRNGQKEYAMVVDPDGTEFNQALVRYDHQYGNGVFGRQRVNLDNQRFIGGVAWRQNEQTYDGALAQLKPLDGLTLTYAYVDNINTIFGPDNGRYDNRTNPANIEGHSHLINAQYVVMPELTVTAYSYLLGLDNIAVTTTAPLGSLSSKTSGLRLNGLVAGFSYALEYAQQKDYADNPVDLDSEYYLAELGYTLKGVQLKGGYEVLGGDNGPGNHAFQTPLATKHIFQGWADQFLTTPADGIEDAYVGFTAPLAGGTLQAWYHDFKTERNSDSYGDEIDLSYAHPIPGVKGLVGLAKYASYRSDDEARTVDTDKVWLQLQYTF
ncbi:alginate export family protein [Pseudomonas boanensis]|uniref:alginate export family protein n=1 Tax=Metapseudomonas boanensis TaxID=2822138 RepID=UPI0035D4096D